MAEQLIFPGFFVEHLLRRTVFFALRPPLPLGLHIEEVAERFRREHFLRPKARPIDRLHLSLHAPHASATQREATVAMNDAAEMVAAVTPAFVLTFDSVMSFKGRDRPLVLLPQNDEADLDALYRRLGQALMQAGLGRGLRSTFTPHLTLLYGKRSIEAQSIDPITWLVRELVLIHSVRGHGHRLLGQWALRG